MKNRYSVSVIVATFNPVWDDLKATLVSIVRQSGVYFEIIIADDGSKNNIKREIEFLFKELVFSDYSYLYSDTNRGTVINILYAVKECHGEYIKVMGQDDLLYSQDILKSLYLTVKKNNLSGIAGRVQCFKKENQEVYLVPVRALPQNSRVFEDKNRLKAQIVIYEDYINGATAFYEKKIFMEYLELIKYKIILCEDLIFRLMVLDERDLGFYEEPIIYYRIETGVSSKGRANLLLKQDLLSYEKMALSKLDNRKLSKTLKARIKMLENESKFSTIRWLFSNPKLLFSWLRFKYNPKMTDSNIHNNFLFECIAEGSTL